MIAIFFDYHMAECDCCGHFLPAEKTDEAAEAAMEADGWDRRAGADICRMCLRKEKETGTLPGRQLFWRYTEHLRQGTPHPPVAPAPSSQGEG